MGSNSRRVLSTFPAELNYLCDFSQVCVLQFVLFFNEYCKTCEGIQIIITQMFRESQKKGILDENDTIAALYILAIREKFLECVNP